MIWKRRHVYWDMLQPPPVMTLSVCRTEIFSGKAVTHEDIKYEQACILYNLGEDFFYHPGGKHVSMLHEREDPVARWTKSE